MPRRYYSSTAFKTTLTADITNVVTSFAVGSVSGWPASFPYTIIVDEGTSSEELMSVTGRSGTTLTVTRGIDGTGAVPHLSGATVKHGVSAQDFDETNSHVNATSGVHGVTGSVVGTTDTQSLSNKTLTSPTITTPSVSSGTFTTPTLTSPTISAATLSGTSTITGTPNADAAGASGIAIQMRQSRGTVGSPTVSTSGDKPGSIAFLGHTGSAYANAAIVRAEVDGTPSATSMPGALSFLTTPSGSTTPLERVRVDNAGLITGTGTSLGAWTSFTPTLNGTGWALGNGTVVGKYCQIGKILFVQCLFQFGSTSTYGANSPYISTAALPNDAARLASGASTAMANINYYDTSATNWYRGFTWDISGFGDFQLQTHGTNGLMGNVSSTAPFTWATGDRIELAFICEAQ